MLPAVRISSTVWSKMASKEASALKRNSYLNKRDSDWTRSCAVSAFMGGPGGASKASATKARSTKKWMMMFLEVSRAKRFSWGIV